MELLQAEIINSCLVCGNINRDEDFVPLCDEQSFQLSSAGELYEELIGLEAMPTDIVCVPKYLCKCCELQMKLFKKMIKKAYETHKNLRKNFQSQANEALMSPVPILTTENEENYPDEEYFENTVSQSNLCDKDTELFGSDVEPPDEQNVEIVNEVHKLSESPNGTAVEAINYDHLQNSGVQLQIHVLNSGTETLGLEMDNNSTSMLEDHLELSEIEDETNETITQIIECTRDKKQLQTFKCCACDLEFSSRCDFSKHRKSVHSGKYPCSECPKLFATSYAAQVHINLHKNMPAYQCAICQKSFNQKVHFKYHMAKHNNVREFQCDRCDKAFLSKADLNMHLRCHNDDRRYACDICGKRFLLRQHLKMHEYSHAGTKSISCTICDQKFVSPSTLRTHLLTIHSLPQFSCEVCGKQFKRKHHLIAHLKIHNDLKSGYVEEYDTVLSEETVANCDYDEFISVE